MSSTRSRKKKDKPIEWVTVAFKGKKIAVSHDTETERILGTKDGDMVRKGKKAIFLNRLQVNPSALIEKDCLMEVKAVRPKKEVIMQNKMTPLEKAKLLLKKNKKEFPEFFAKLKKAAPGESVKMPQELSSRIFAEHIKNVGDKLQGIELAQSESLANAHKSAPKVYC